MTSSPRASLSAGESPAARTSALPLAPVLAVDYGRRRIGLALSDALGLTAQPLATLTRSNRRNDLRRLREIVRVHGVRLILVGHPVHLDGSPSEMAEEAARFAARLAKHLGLPVQLVDERLSSWEAQQLQPRETHARKRIAGRGRKNAAQLDQVAAAVILRGYLDREHARKQARG
jgi:putative Holliday junction resolvase